VPVNAGRLEIGVKDDVAVVVRDTWVISEVGAGTTAAPVGVEVVLDAFEPTFALAFARVSDRVAESESILVNATAERSDAWCDRQGKIKCA
jgi:hypothetical protein